MSIQATKILKWLQDWDCIKQTGIFCRYTLDYIVLRRPWNEQTSTVTKSVISMQISIICKKKLTLLGKSQTILQILPENLNHKVTFVIKFI